MEISTRIHTIIKQMTKNLRVTGKDWQTPCTVNNISVYYRKKHRLRLALKKMLKQTKQSMLSSLNNPINILCIMMEIKGFINHTDPSIFQFKNDPGV